MTTPSPLDEIDTAVQELRLEQQQSAFTRTLASIVSALGVIPDSPPQDFTAAAIVRLRELADETVVAIERRIDSGADDDKTQQRLAGTVYEVRRRMEVIDVWFRNHPSDPRR